MTVRCGGGTSSVIPGVASNLVLATGAAGIFSLVPGLEWLVALGSALGVLTYDLSQICATDPPSMPTFTADEIISFTTVQLGTANFQSFLDKANDLAAIIVWDKYCKCDNGTAIPAEQYPAQPPVSVINNQSGNTCGFASFSGLAAMDNVGPGYTDAYLGLPSAGLGPKATQGSLTNIQSVKIPSGVTSVNWRVRNAQSDINNTNGANVVIGFLNNTTILGTSCPNCSTSSFNNDLTGSITVPSGALYYTMVVDTNHVNSSTPKQIDINITNVCGGTLGQATNACPSDPAVLALLNQIITLLTLIQRQLVPFAYILGAVHSGLSGTNVLTVSQLIGMKIEITTVPPRTGLEIADPDEIFAVGWISWGSADGFEAREWITKNPMISLPANCQVLDRFSYNFLPGVVASLTELEREA